MVYPILLKSIWLLVLPFVGAKHHSAPRTGTSPFALSLPLPLRISIGILSWVGEYQILDMFNKPRQGIGYFDTKCFVPIGCKIRVSKWAVKNKQCSSPMDLKILSDTLPKTFIHRSKFVPKYKTSRSLAFPNFWELLHSAYHTLIFVKMFIYCFGWLDSWGNRLLNCHKVFGQE